MKIFGVGFSNYVHAVRTTAFHLGLEHEHEPLRPNAAAEDAPDFRKASPSGRIPALLDGDFGLNESNAIMVYLCSKKPGVLMPADAQGQALVQQWLSFALAHWARGWNVLQFELLAKKMFGMGEADPALVETGLANFHRHAALIEAHLDGREWLVGDSLTIADIALAAGLLHHAGVPLPTEAYPRMIAWHGRVSALPAWAQAAA
jgi:glutathione S-transferase